MSGNVKAGYWKAIPWTCHAATSIVIDDQSVITGKRIIAECAEEIDARRIVDCVNELAGVREVTGHVHRLEDQRDKLLAALKDCAEDMECWADYASEYFQEKHRLQDDIAKYNAIIAEIEAAK